MASQRKISANRLNGKKSRGPRTVAGKRRSMANALRHGLSAVKHRPAIFRLRVKNLADAICGSDKGLVLYEQAIAIAENELLIQEIKSQRVAVIERLRDPYALPLAKAIRVCRSQKQ